MSDIEPDPHATFLEYVGIAGATKECQEAIERLLMSGADLRSALILTCQDGANPDHAFFLTIGEHDELIVKSGFPPAMAAQSGRFIGSFRPPALA